MKGKRARHANILLEVAQLAPKIVLSDPGTPNVIAKCHRNPLLQGCLGIGDNALEDHIAVKLLDLACTRDGAIEQRIRQRRRKRSAQEGVSLLEQAHHFVRWSSAVLDRVYATLERRTHAFG